MTLMISTRDLKLLRFFLSARMAPLNHPGFFFCTVINGAFLKQRPPLVHQGTIIFYNMFIDFSETTKLYMFRSYGVYGIITMLSGRFR
jgi:hypothetical protein